MLSYGDVMDARVVDGLPSYPRDVACVTLDAIDAAGIKGADVATLINETGLTEALLREVLHDLHKAGLARRLTDGRYLITPLGEQVRLLAGD